MKPFSAENHPNCSLNTNYTILSVIWGFHEKSSGLVDVISPIFDSRSGQTSFFYHVFHGQQVFEYIRIYSKFKMIFEYYYSEMLIFEYIRISTIRIPSLFHSRPYEANF